MKGFYEIRRVQDGDGQRWELWRYNILSWRDWWRGKQGGWEFICTKPSELSVRRVMDSHVNSFLRRRGKPLVLNADRYGLDGGEFRGGGWA
jgi:hypothetical protein